MSVNKDLELCRRGEPRQDVELDAVAFRLDGSRSIVALSNMSYSGCQFSGHQQFAPAEPIRLIVPYRGDIGARVRWASSDRAGATFDPDRSASDAVPLPDRSAMRLACPFNYGSGRRFGKKGLPPE